MEIWSSRQTLKGLFSYISGYLMNLLEKTTIQLLLDDWSTFLEPVLWLTCCVFCPAGLPLHPENMHGAAEGYGAVSKAHLQYV